MPEGFKTQATRLLTTSASFWHKADPTVSITGRFWAGCKIYHKECDLSGFCELVEATSFGGAARVYGR